MANVLTQLRQKASGTATALGNMTAKQREQPLSAAAVQDYNHLRTMVIEAKADLGNLLPPAIESWTTEVGAFHANANYQDLHGFVLQIVNLLDAGMPRTGFIR